jgi:hypothetical protein
MSPIYIGTQCSLEYNKESFASLNLSRSLFSNTLSPRTPLSDEQDYLCMYYITQQVPVRVSKVLYHGLIDWMTWNVVYSLFREARVDTKVYAISSSFPHPGFWNMILEAY